MKTKTTFAVLPLVMLLAACGQGTGTGTTGGSSSDVSASDSSGFSVSKSLGLSKSARANVSFPASGVILGALQDRYVRYGGKPSFAPKAFGYLAIVDNGSNSERANDVMPSHDDLMSEARTIIKLIRDGKLSQSDIDRSPVDQIEAAKAGDVDALVDALYRQRALGVIVAFAQPINGWPVNPMSRAGADVKDTHRYIDWIERGSEFSNLVLTELAAKLSTNVWRDPDAAKAAVLRAWDTLSFNTLSAAWRMAQIKSASDVTIDLAGSNDVHWTSANGDYHGDGAGWTVTRNGAPWYGQGYLSGRQIVIGLESSINASMQKGNDSNSSTGSKSGVDTGGKAQVR